VSPIVVEGRNRTTGVRLAFATSALAAGLAGASAGASEEGERDPRVRVATTGNQSERIETMPITRAVGAEKRVVMSLGPGRLPDLMRGDRVRITAELGVTTECYRQLPRCRRSPYRYDPRVRAQLVLAASPKAKGKRRTMAISERRHETCTQRRPQYEHHCILTFRHAGFRVRAPQRLPCALNRCHVNLVADVHHPRASSNEVMVVGGQRPSGKIKQDRGRINAIRYRNTVPSDFHTTGTRQLRFRAAPPDLKKRVAISKRLRGLRRGEQLAITAGFRERISHLPYAVRTSVYLILAESPRKTRPGRFVRSHAVGFGEISENNGQNCTTPPGTCGYSKVGVLEMRSDAVTPGGRRKPLYVNLVVVLGPKVREARARDRVRLRKGRIRLERFPPRLRG
jgi:hypothetical protein